MSEEIMAGIADEPATENATQADEVMTGIADEPATTEDNAGAATETEKPATEPYTLDAIEGFNVPDDNLRDFGERCNKLGLTKEQAQGILQWHKEQADASAANIEQLERTAISAWDKELRDDPEFGGQNFKRTYANAVRALREFDPDGSMRELLRTSKYQYNPVIIKTIARVGAAMGEHYIVGANGEGAGEQIPLEKRLFPDM